MPKRSNRLPLFAILCLALALIFVAAIFIWLNFGGGSKEGGNDGEKEGGQKGEEAATKVGQNVPMPTSTGGTTIGGGGGEGDKTPEAPGEGTTGTVEEDEQQLEETPSSSPASTLAHHSMHAPVCPQPNVQGVLAECQGEKQQQSSPSIKWPDEQQPEERVRPFEYALNISLPMGQPTALRAQLSILAELTEESDTMALHYGRHLGTISGAEVHIWDCQSGSFICVRSLTRLLDKQILVLEFAQPLPRGTLIRLHFSHLLLPLSSPSLLVQIPSPWERDRAWMIGSQLPLAGGARALFPSVDSASSRTVLRLCLTHPADVLARANTMAEWSSKNDDQMGGGQQHIQTCFKETPALPPSQFAFLLFRNLRSVPSIGDDSKTEMFIGGHLQPDDYRWTIEESEQAMKRMSELTGVGYPMERLTLVSSPLAPGNDTVGGLGLAQIRDSWIEYPKFVHTHNLLIGQIVRQWASNMLSLCDSCLQRGMAIFLEWVLAAELGPAEDKAAEFRRRIGEARHRLLANDQTSQVAVDQCDERAAFVLHMLDQAFGRPTIMRFLTSLFRRHSWASMCTPTTELSQLFLEASQGQSQAQHVFDSFLLFDPPMPFANASIPLIHLRVQPQHSLLLLSQQSIDDSSNNTNAAQNHDHQHWVPMELVDDTGKSTRLVLNQSELALPLVISSFLLAQPSSFARFTYNVDNYEQLLECMGQEQASGGGKCPSVDRLALKDGISDLCWALLHQRLATADEEVPRWRQLFHSLSARGLVQGDCACCLLPEADALRGHCRWTWLDKCSRIALLSSATNGRRR